MTRISDMPLKYRVPMMVYPWRKIQPVPCAALDKPLSEARVALVTSGGLVAPGDEPFDETVKGGDYSYRVISAEVETQALTEHHRSDTFDHAGIEADRNLAMPLDRLREIAAEGLIGEVAPRHLSFMGSITAPGRLVKKTMPEAVELLVEDRIDVALLVPV